MTTHTHAILDGQPVAIPKGAVAWKRTDPTEEARWLYDEAEATEIAREDDSLIVWVRGLLAVAAATDYEAWQWAAREQGYTGDYDAWTQMAEAERAEYEDGAQGIGTA